MKIRGLNETIKKIDLLLDIVQLKIDNVDWNKPGADAKDERLNDAWETIDNAKNQLTEMKQL